MNEFDQDLALPPLQILYCSLKKKKKVQWLRYLGMFGMTVEALCNSSIAVWMAFAKLVCCVSLSPLNPFFLLLFSRLIELLQYNVLQQRLTVWACKG